MRVLMIGQLPAEAGGNYTTGAGNVVYALSKQQYERTELYLYVKNASQLTINSKYGQKSFFFGYRYLLLDIIVDFLLHMKRFISEWNHYKTIDHENPLRYTFYKVNIEKCIRTIRPDIIHVHSIKDVSPTKFAMCGKSIPLLLTCHGIAYRGENTDNIVYHRYFGNLPMCDYFTGLTQDAEREFIDYLKLPRNKFTIIPNGVDVSKFFYSEEFRYEVRKTQNVNNNQIVFITVASLQNRKGQLEFIKLIKNINLPYQYWLIGMGEDEQPIRECIEEYNLTDQVKLLGYVPNDDLYKYYSAADFYVHSSHREGQALSEIEAYTTGMRIIVNKEVSRTVVGDIEKESQRYFIYDSKSMELSSLQKWIQSSQIKRKTYPNFSWSEISKKYCEIYQFIVNK